jgi:hypothetical protein
MPDKWKLLIQTHPCGDRVTPGLPAGVFLLTLAVPLRVERAAHEDFSGALLTFHEVRFRGAEKGCGPARARAGVRQPEAEFSDPGRALLEDRGLRWVSWSVRSLSGPEPLYGAIRSYPVASGSPVRARQPGMASGFRLLSPAPASPPLLHNPVFSL